MCFKKMKKYNDQLYLVFRVLVGLLFFQHGAQKLLGWFGAGAEGIHPLFSTLGIAGVIELVGGLAIAVGLFTRLAALLGGLLMLTAYSMVHAGNGLIPIMNLGELALLYFASFIVIFIYGGQKWTLDEVLFKKERF